MQSTAAELSGNLIVLFGPTPPTGKSWRSPPVAVTSAVPGKLAGLWKILAQAKGLLQNVIPLFHTHLPLHWAGAASPASALSSEATRLFDLNDSIIEGANQW